MATPDPATDRATMVEKLGGVGELAFDFAFGDIWSRKEMSRRDRSLVVMSILATLGVSAELALHVSGGLRHGLMRAEIEEIMVQLCIYAGFPRAVGGIRVAREVFAKVDAHGARL